MDVNRECYGFFDYNFGSAGAVPSVPNLDLINDPVLLDTGGLVEYDGSDLDVQPMVGRSDVPAITPQPAAQSGQATPAHRQRTTTTTTLDTQPKCASSIFICDRCNMAFTTETKLKRHGKSHLYEKPHKCDHCAEDFNVIENLMLHNALHNKRPFRCPQCGKIFNRLSSLEGHIKSHFKSEYFVCAHCAEMFHYEARLKEHMRNVHPHENYKLQDKRVSKSKAPKLSKGKTLKCKFCPKEFKKNCLLVRHERIHKGERPFKCDTCGRTFVQKNSLVIHQLAHAGARPHQCPKCPQSFTQRGNLVVHQLRCHNEGNDAEFPYACSQCTCVFKKLGPLNAHISKCHSATIETTSEPPADDDFGFKDVMQQLQSIRRPDPIEMQHPVDARHVATREPDVPMVPIAVPIPTKTVDVTAPTEDSSVEVAEHKSDGSVQYRQVQQTTVGAERWLVCVHCPKKFRRPSDLLRHVRIHTKEKPFECPVAECRRRFAIKGTLNVHMRVHDKNPLRYSCPTCTRKFSSATTLDVHCLAAHDGVLGFKCNQCRAAFSQSQPFKAHLRYHHSDPHKESMRRAAAARHKQELMSDERFHIQMDEPVQMDAVPQTAEPIAATVARDPQTFYCEICLLHFKRKHTLKQHMNTHRGVKPYQCQLCEKSFASSFSLKRHLQYHSSDKPFTCSICGVSFVTAAVLKRHSLKHSEIRNYMCPYCKKRFKSRTQCRQHMQLHKVEIMKHLRERVVTVSAIQDPLMAGEGYQLIDQSTLGSHFAQPSEEPPPSSEPPTVPTDTNGSNNVQQLDEYDDDNNDQVEYILVFDNCSQNHQPPIPTDDNTVDTVNHNANGIYAAPSYVYLDLDVPQPNEESSCVDHIEAPPCTQSADDHPTDSLRSGPKPHRSLLQPCQHCDKVFKKPVDLRRHLRTHTGERPFACSRCPKAFSLLCTLNEHLKVHDSTKQKFPCHICRKGFTTKRSLGIHMRIHAGQKPYKCTFCALCFRTNGHQRRHERVHIKEAVRLNCDPIETQTKKATTKLQPLIEATEIFIRNGDDMQLTKLNFVEQIGLRPDEPLIDDESKDNNVHETLWCYVCSDDVDNETKATEAVEKKTKPEIKCSTCEKSFKKLSLLQRHMVVHTKDKPYPCSVCNKSFVQRASMTAHMLTHNEKKLFKCSVCMHEFNYKTNLQRHVKSCTQTIQP